MSEIYIKFTSLQNKGLIWKLLGDDGAFNSIPENKYILVKAEFDRKFEMISQEITPEDNLVNLDKRIIREMMQELIKYTLPSKVQPIEDMYNAADIAQKRQKIFEAELSNKKKDFDTFNNVKVPEKIDFSDNLDSPMSGEMDKILAEQIALREKQLSMVLKTQDKEAATKWIQNPSDNVAPEPTKLKIGEKIQLDIKESIKPKKVAFIENDNDLFLTLLKKKDTPPEDTNSLLREILTKQNEILNILKTKN